MHISPPCNVVVQGVVVGGAVVVGAGVVVVGAGVVVVGAGAGVVVGTEEGSEHFPELQLRPSAQGPI